MAWYVWGIMASVLWGLQYALYGQLVKSASPALIMAVTGVTTLPIWLLMAWRDKGATLESLSQPQVVTGMVAMGAVACCASWAIIMSIKLKNPTLAAILEMSYPFFTAMFAYVLFREVHLSWQAALGGLLILAGVVVILTAESAHG